MGNPYSFGSRSVETLRLQKALLALQIDAGTADGIYGHQTQAAVEVAQQRFGLPVNGLVDDHLLIALKLKDAFVPASNPISDFITQAALKAIIVQIAKGLPMSLISGYKTYAVSIVSILVGVCDWIGFDIPGTNGMPPAAYILGGLIALFGRAGIAKIAEDVIAKLGGVDPNKL